MILKKASGKHTSKNVKFVMSNGDIISGSPHISLYSCEHKYKIIGVGGNGECIDVDTVCEKCGDFKIVTVQNSEDAWKKLIEVRENLNGEFKPEDFQTAEC